MALGRTLLLGCCLLAGAAAALAAGDEPPVPKKDPPRRFDVRRLLEQFDTNKDGFLDASECPERLKARFEQLDLDKDGKLSREELVKAAALFEKITSPKGADAKGKAGARPGEIITPAARGERQTDRLKVGDPAPDFILPDLHGENEVTLSSFWGKRPVVLIFGSYT